MCDSKSGSNAGEVGVGAKDGKRVGLGLGWIMWHLAWDSMDGCENGEEFGLIWMGNMLEVKWAVVDLERRR